MLTGYRQSDPRSFIVRKTADEVFAITGKDELLETAMALHDAAMKDEFFTSRKLAPNVDFWSGLIYRAMGALPFLATFTTALLICPARFSVVTWRLIVVLCQASRWTSSRCYSSSRELSDG